MVLSPVKGRQGGHAECVRAAPWSSAWPTPLVRALSSCPGLRPPDRARAGPADTRAGTGTSAGCYVTNSPLYCLLERRGRSREARAGHRKVWTLNCRQPATRPSASGSEDGSKPRAGRAEWPQPAQPPGVDVEVHTCWHCQAQGGSRGGQARCLDPDAHPYCEPGHAGPHFMAWGLRPAPA